MHYTYYNHPKVLNNTVFMTVLWKLLKCCPTQSLQSLDHCIRAQQVWFPVVGLCYNKLQLQK